MNITPIELIQVKWALGCILRVTPDQLSNVLHAWQRAKQGGDISMPMQIALDEAASQLPKSEKTEIGVVYTWLHANSPRYDEKRDGFSLFAGQPLKTKFVRHGHTKLDLSAEGIRLILDWMSAHDEKNSSRRSVLTEIEENIGCSQRQLWRYAANGLPKRMNARVRSAFELLAIAAQNNVPNSDSDCYSSDS